MSVELKREERTEATATVTEGACGGVYYGVDRGEQASNIDNEM